MGNFVERTAVGGAGVFRLILKLSHIRGLQRKYDRIMTALDFGVKVRSHIANRGIWTTFIS